jgi:hypothetical protein
MPVSSHLVTSLPLVTTGFALVTPLHGGDVGPAW